MNQNWRLNLLLVLFLFMSGILLGRLFQLQVLDYDYYKALAKNQHEIYEKLLPQRGKILMQDLSSENEYPALAIDKEFQQVYLIPRNISFDKKEILAEKLSNILDIEKKDVLRKANKKNDPYEPLAHKVEDSKIEAIKKIDIKGVGILPETWRYYPYKDLASHIVGFVSRQNNQRVGQYGLEKSFQNELSGHSGIIYGRKDISGFYIPSLKKEFRAAQDGSDLVLTLDENIQFRAEKELKQALKKYKAESGSIIVMDPQTGAIRAMANLPEFDPNKYSQVDKMSVFLNPAVQKVYEPGSVFKPITMAIGLESGSITTKTTYQDKGRVKVGGRIIKNVDGKAYGKQNMTQVLEKSLNTGAVFIQQETSVSDFRSYIQKFGLGKSTGIELPGEVGGNIFNLFTNRDVNLATISFGQGISVTPLGLLDTISIIANEGKKPKPYIVAKKITSDGKEDVTEISSQEQVISPETSNKVTRMMVSVVENGFGKNAQVQGYNIAGKTGTAQIPDSEKGGYSEETIHSFVGFAPAFDPEFAILIKLNKPQNVRFSSNSAAFVFRNLAEYLLNYLEIPPK